MSSIANLVGGDVNIETYKSVKEALGQPQVCAVKRTDFAAAIAAGGAVDDPAARRTEGRLVEKLASVQRGGASGERGMTVHLVGGGDPLDRVLGQYLCFDSNKQIVLTGQHPQVADVFCRFPAFVFGE